MYKVYGNHTNAQQYIIQYQSTQYQSTESYLLLFVSELCGVRGCSLQFSLCKHLFLDSTHPHYNYYPSLIHHKLGK